MSELRLEAEVIVPPTAHWRRLDEFVRVQLSEWPLTAIRRAVAAGQIRVNARQRTAGWRLRAGDRVRWQLTAPSQVRVPVTDFNLPVLYEDEVLLVVAKPPGMLSHPTPQERTGTLLNCLLAHPAFSTGTNRPMLLHRLDRDTSGLVLVAKNDRGTRAFAPLFQAGDITKTYLALVVGHPDVKLGTIEAPIGRSPFLWPRWRVMADGKQAQTNFAVLLGGKHWSLVRFQPLTGRTHQIRIHAAHLGHPILGDLVYGRQANQMLVVETNRPAPRHMLHAAEVCLCHPLEKRQMHFCAPQPDDFTPWLEAHTQPGYLGPDYGQ
ncbi:MAG: RluA family pseudouridine synthase [Acidobacteriota bacterium]